MAIMIKEVVRFDVDTDIAVPEFAETEEVVNFAVDDERMNLGIDIENDQILASGAFRKMHFQI